MLELKERFHIKTQVLVVGGGPSGIAAAISAARKNVNVLLAESASCLGGMATSALVGPFMTCYDIDGKHQIIKGFFEEIVQRMVAKGGAIHPSNCKKGSSYSAYRTRGHSNVGPFNSDVLKLVAEEMCDEAGVELLYNANLIDVITDGSKATAAVFGVPGGVGVVDADIIIDCTGNGDAAYLSGVPMEKPEKVQPASMFFLIDGVDKEGYEALKETQPDDMVFLDLISKLYDSGEYTIPKKKLAIYESCDGTWRVNMTRVNDVDGTDPFEVTKASVELRKQIPVVIDMLKKHIDICKNVRITQTADKIGIRETRRIVGDFVLTADDMRKSRMFDDNIAICANSFDMHTGDTVQYETAPKMPYGVPYRCLVPRNIENILVAGRCMSCTREALAAIRVMPPCFAFGQAAGVAAAIAIDDKCNVANIKIEKLQKILRENGAILSYDDIEK